MFPKLSPSFIYKSHSIGFGLSPICAVWSLEVSYPDNHSKDLKVVQASNRKAPDII